jgi:rhodanese-related sulfurtransferase
MITRISPAEALSKMTDEGYAYVDVRTPADFEEGHPSGAYNVPLVLEQGGGVATNTDFVAAIEAFFGKDAKLVIGCRAGVVSVRAARLLVDAGFASVLEQRAGFCGAKSPFGQTTEKGWEALGLPSEEGAPPGRTWTDLQRCFARS